MRLIYAKPAYSNGVVCDVGNHRQKVLNPSRKYYVEFAIRGEKVTDVWLQSVEFPVDSRYLTFEYKGEKMEVDQIWK